MQGSVACNELMKKKIRRIEKILVYFELTEFCLKITESYVILKKKEKMKRRGGAFSSSPCGGLF